MCTWLAVIRHRQRAGRLSPHDGGAGQTTGRRRGLAFLAAVVVCASALTFTRGGVAFSQAAPSLSPEEAVISLIPYKVTARDLPSGYQAGPLGVSTPATLAVLSSDPGAALQTRINSGFIVGISQVLRPSATGTAPAAQLIVFLMNSAAAAKAYATGQAFPLTSTATSNVEPVDLGPAMYGEAQSAYHITVTPPDQTPLGEYLVRWQRGQLVFTLLIQATAGTEKLADLTALAGQIDAHEASLPAPQLGPATVTAPATEQDRLVALALLNDVFVKPADAPIGYRLAGAAITPNAAIVATADDPRATLRRVDEQWQRVMEVSEAFATPQGGSGPILEGSAAIDASPSAAQVDLRDVLTGPGVTVTPFDPGISLGDAMNAVRETSTAPDGTVREAIEIGWTHGPVLLGVATAGPQGSTSLDDLLGFAQQWEDVYQSTRLAGIAGGGAAASGPAASPTPRPAAPAATAAAAPPPSGTPAPAAAAAPVRQGISTPTPQLPASVVSVNAPSQAIPAYDIAIDRPLVK